MDVRVESNLVGISDRLGEEYQMALENALQRAVWDLEANSPRGVSSTGLAESWRYEIDGSGLYLTGRILNDAPNSLFRMIGRGPGRMPPYWEGTSIERWATSVGMPAYALAKQIAEKGTARWRRGSNILGWRNGQADEESKPLRIFSETLESEMRSVTI